MVRFTTVIGFFRPRRCIGVLGVAAAALLVGACGRGPNLTSRIDPGQVRPIDEVAVVTVRTAKVYQNRLQEESASETKGVREAVNTIKKMSKRDARRADPRYGSTSTQVRDFLFGPFRSAAPFSLLAEDRVLESSPYQEFQKTRGAPSNASSSWRTSLFATPQGYRSLDPAQLKGDVRLRSLIEKLPSRPDGVLFAETKYTLIRDQVQKPDPGLLSLDQGPSHRGTTPSGTTLDEGDTVRVDVKATVRVRVLDRGGGTVLKVVQAARSDEGFTFVYGQGWQTDQIDGPTRQATRAALGKITTYLQNNLPGGILADAPEPS